jgi:hypothetical protein
MPDMTVAEEMLALLTSLDTVFTPDLGEAALEAYDRAVMLAEELVRPQVPDPPGTAVVYVHVPVPMGDSAFAPVMAAIRVEGHDGRRYRARWQQGHDAAWSALGPLLAYTSTDDT